MAKFHYVQRQRKFVHANASITTPTSTLTFVASRTLSDTYVRSVWSPRIVTRIDDTVNPPTDEWWTTAEVSFTARFSKDGTTGAGASEDDATVLGIMELYPIPIPPTIANALHYVLWQPLNGPLVLETSRKGDGVHFPRVISAMWPNDVNAVFLNPGGLYSVVHSFSWHGVVVWASDNP